MKKHLCLAAALAASNVCDANIFQNLLNRKPNRITIDGHNLVEVESKLFPGSYYYSMAKTNQNNGTDMYFEMNTVTNQAPTPELAQQIAAELRAKGLENVQVHIEVEKIPGSEQSLPRVNLPADESVVEKTEEQKARDMVYGDDGVVSDPYVLEAWERAELAEKKLKEHREYMKKVLRARQATSNQKKIEAGLESTEMAKTIDNKI